MGIFVGACIITALCATTLQSGSAVGRLKAHGLKIIYQRETPTWMDGILGDYRFDGVKRLYLDGGLAGRVDVDDIAKLHSLDAFSYKDVGIPFDQSCEFLLPLAAGIRDLEIYEAPSSPAEFFNKFGKLEHLRISRDLDFQEIDSLSGLKTLVFESGAPRNISNLPCLFQLVVRAKSFEDGDGLRNLPELRLLILKGTGIDELGFVENLPQLTILDISETNVSDFQPLSVAENLKALTMSCNRIEDWKVFESFEELEALVLHEIPHEGPILHSLKKLKSLRGLRLEFAERTCLNTADFPDFYALKQLRIENAKIMELTDTAFPNLERLLLINVEIDSDSLEEFTVANPMVEIIRKKKVN